MGKARPRRDVGCGITKPRCCKVTRAEALRREAGYFQDNYRRMQYLETREEGFPIGSGMVESACKQFRARLAGAGMRWSRVGLERLLPIRAAIMSQRFDEVWQKVYHLPQI